MIANAYIIDAVRTPRGRSKSDKGALSSVRPQELFATTLRALADRATTPERVGDVIVGSVSQVGEQGGNLARNAVRAAGWPVVVPGVTLNRFCSSGLQAVHFGAMAVASGALDLVVAGGVESMSRVPMGSDGAGQDGGNQHLRERFFQVPQAISADLIATLALRPSFVEMGALVAGPNGETLDQLALAAHPTRDGSIRHVHTAGNPSGLADGAAAVALASQRYVDERGVRPRARICAMVTVGSDPVQMLTGPAPASERALRQAGMSVSDIDLLEFNEAFAAVVLQTERALGIDPERVNVNGGAIALGHPLGATGAILLGTALGELERSAKPTALVTMCGGGQGISTILERT